MEEGTRVDSSQVRFALKELELRPRAVELMETSQQILQSRYLEQLSLALGSRVF